MPPGLVSAECRDVSEVLVFSHRPSLGMLSLWATVQQLLENCDPTRLMAAIHNQHITLLSVTVIQQQLIVGMAFFLKQMASFHFSMMLFMSIPLVFDRACTVCSAVAIVMYLFYFIDWSWQLNLHCLVISLLCISLVSSGKPELKSEVDIIVADVGDPDSLAAMCKQGVIVLNCVGPVSIQHKVCDCSCSSDSGLYSFLNSMA